MNSAPRVVIIGGGISGLSAAFFLAQKGIRPTLLEKSGQLGGLIRTDRVNGCDLEAGPDSFIATKPALLELARELGIADHVIGSNDPARRIFIARNGRLTAMPPGMVMMVPGDLDGAMASDFFSVESKAGFLREAQLPPFTRTEDVSIETFVRDHFESELLDYVTEPLLAGVYGGNSGCLSARSVLPRFVHYEEQYGSLIRGVQQERSAPREGSLFLSFRDGMQTVTDAIVSAIAPHTAVRDEEACELSSTAQGWRVHVRSGATYEADHVVLACPAYVNGKLLERSAPELSVEFAAIPYSSAILLTLVFEKASLQPPLDGFGFLVPSRERRTVAAATWVSTKFPSRTPGHLAAIRTFLVGSEAEQWMPAAEEALLGAVGEDLQRLMGIAANPVFHTLYRWPHSMPQYTVGHQERIRRLRSHADQYPGLHFCGNAYDGVGIPDCVRLARQVSSRIES